jgi:hypothetical protein
LFLYWNQLVFLSFLAVWLSYLKIVVFQTAEREDLSHNPPILCGYWIMVENPDSFVRSANVANMDILMAAQGVLEYVGRHGLAATAGAGQRVGGVFPVALYLVIHGDDSADNCFFGIGYSAAYRAVAFLLHIDTLRISKWQIVFVKKPLAYEPVVRAPDKVKQKPRHRYALELSHAVYALLLPICQANCNRLAFCLISVEHRKIIQHVCHLYRYKEYAQNRITKRHTDCIHVLGECQDSDRMFIGIK